MEDDEGEDGEDDADDNAADVAADDEGVAGEENKA